MNSSWLERTKNTKLDLWDSWNRELGDRKCSRGPGGLTHGELVFDGLCASVRLMASSDNNAEGYITLQMYSIPPNQHLEMVKTVLAVVAYNFNFRAQVDLLIHGQLHSVTLSPKKKKVYPRILGAGRSWNAAQWTECQACTKPKIQSLALYKPSRMVHTSSTWEMATGWLQFQGHS